MIHQLNINVNRNEQKKKTFNKIFSLFIYIEAGINTACARIINATDEN